MTFEETNFTISVGAVEVRELPSSDWVGRPGLEPGTLGLKVPCSSQMS